MSEASDIEALAKAIRGAPAPKAFSSADFCRLWAQVKPILEAMKPIAGLVPVIGPLVSAALTTLLTLGSAANAALCGK
jgi:hypothetical protein